MTQQAATQPRFIRKPAVSELVGVSAQTLWRWSKAGKFPKPIRLTERVTVWAEQDVLAWLDAKTKGVHA